MGQQLAQLRGTEYKVDFETRRKDMESAPAEFTSYCVIYELNRLSPKQTELQRIYYCPGMPNHPHFGSIFPMPAINMVFNNKMRSAVWHLNEAQKKLQSEKFEQIIKHKHKESTSKKEKKRKKKEQKKQRQTQQNQYSSLVQGLIMDLQR